MCNILEFGEDIVVIASEAPSLIPGIQIPLHKSSLSRTLTGNLQENMASH